MSFNVPQSNLQIVFKHLQTPINHILDRNRNEFQDLKPVLCTSIAPDLSVASI